MRGNSKIFVINKSKGMTSFDIIRKIKRNLPKDLRKIGHLGTLDHFASGVLLVGMDKALRLNEQSQRFFTKTYLATGIFGSQTDSGDPNGKIINIAEQEDLLRVEKLSYQEISSLLSPLVGEYWQAPPIYSAAKYQGKRLSDLARKGIIIEKEKKKREVFKLELVKLNFPEIIFRSEVSSGTYIRTLFEDICERLGIVGHLQDLVRESIGHFSLENSLSRDDYFNFESHQDFLSKGIDIDLFFPFPQVVLTEKQSNLFSHGNFISYYTAKNSNSPHAIDSENIWVYNHENSLIGLGIIKDHSKDLFPKIIF